MAVFIVSFLTSVLGIIIFLFTTVYIYYKFVVYNYWRKRDIVHEEPTFPVGNFGSIILGKINPGVYFMNCYKKFKKHRYFGSFSFFEPQLVINDPDLIRLVLTKEFAHFHDRNMYSNEKIDPLTGHLFLIPGQKWKNLRIKLSPTFTSGKMKMMFGTVQNCGDELHQYLKEREGQDVDIKDIFARFTTDVIMSTAFGVQSNSLKNPNSEFRYWGKKVFESKPVLNTIFFFAPKILEILRMPYFDKDLTVFFVNVFQETVNLRKKENSNNRRDFLDLLIQLMRDGYVEDDNGNIPSIADSIDGKLTLLESVAQAFVFFIAGFETSSTTATYCLYELALNTKIQDKVRAEIKSILQKDGGLSYDNVNNMPYLHKVISETLRKYPVVTLLNRVCTKDITLETTNLLIKKGTDIQIPLLGIHRDPDIYPDPEKFDPERFNEQNIAARHSYTYLPFGEGPRICIGMRFGLMQTKIAIINALTACQYKVSPSTQQPLVIDPGNLIYATKNTINLHLTPLAN